MANQAQTSRLQLSAMSYAIGGGVANEAHLLPPRDFRPDDGRPLKVDSFKMSANIAAKVITAMSKRKNDTLIDYEHQSLLTKENGQPVIAAGWFHDMEFREDGLWAVGIGWTATASKRLQEKEYRYISAVFTYSLDTGEIEDIVSVALTNQPALDGLNAVAAFSKSNPQFLTHQDPEATGEVTMSDKDLAALTLEHATVKSQNIALTTENTTLKADVVALSKQRDDATTELAAIKKTQAEAALTANKEKHTALLTAALSDGRLAPAQKTWAEKQSLEALTEYLDSSVEILPKDRQHDDNKKGANPLNETELAMCTKLGVSPEDFIKNR